MKSCLFFSRNYHENFGWYTTQFWSLAVEEHFYFLWPATLALLAPRRALAAAVLSALAIAVWRFVDAAFHIVANVFPYSIPEHRTDTRLDALLWACVIAIIFPQISGLLHKTRFGHLFPMIFGVLVFVCSLVKAAGTAVPFLSVLKPILIPLMIVSTVTFPSGLIGRMLEFPALRFVGRISYSLYLWQQPLLILDSASGTHRSAWQHWPAALIGVIACATASYYLIERPMIRLGHHLRRPSNKPLQVARLGGLPLLEEAASVTNLRRVFSHARRIKLAGLSPVTLETEVVMRLASTKIGCTQKLVHSNSMMKRF